MRPLPRYYTPNPGEVWQGIDDTEVGVWSASRPEGDPNPVAYLEMGTNITVIKRRRRNRYGDVYYLVLVGNQLGSIVEDCFNSQEMKRVL